METSGAKFTTTQMQVADRYYCLALLGRTEDRYHDNAMLTALGLYAIRPCRLDHG
jgi:hypothetical protein